VIWVEIRHLAFIGICMSVAIEAALVLAVTHANGATIFMTLLVLSLLALGLFAAFNALNRGRRARYAPVLLDWLGITSGVAYALWQVFDLCRGLRSARDATALVMGLAIALVAIGAIAAQRRRRTVR
jgi:hypothetical protein